MKTLKTTIAAVAVGATALLPMATAAQAHDRGYGHRHEVRNAYCHRDDRNCDGRIDHRDHRGHKIVKKKRRHTNDDIAGAAILGIIGGAIIGGIVSNANKQPHYTAPRKTYNHNTFPPAPRAVQRQATYGGSLEPWSRGWYQYCDAKYRSFNPQKGTFRGYDGKDHFCVAR